MKSSIFNFLKQKIDQFGPLKISDYMRYRLHSPEIGYYFNAQGTPLIGAAGDFITAPEVSPLFGEIIAVWVLERWIELDKPTFGLVEWGPGRGHLIADILRTFQVLPEIFTKMNIHLIEKSPFLTKLQQQQLRSFDQCSITWHEQEHTVPWQQPIIGLGNEFLDTFPIDQWIFTEKGWVERRITYDDNALQWQEQQSATLPTHLEQNDETLGTIIEYSEEAYQFVLRLGSYIKEGSLLFIDYGSFLMKPADTLQAMRHHGFISVLNTDYIFDLTAHVNFAVLNKAAKEAGFSVQRQLTQAAFLEQLGILTRALALQKSQKQSHHISLIHQQLFRLLNSAEMGSLFKVVEWKK